MEEVQVDSRLRLSNIRGRLVLLTVALLAPALLLTGILLWNVERQARAAMESQVTATARALSLVVDRQIGQQAAVVEALSAVPSLKTGDWQAFHVQAAETVRSRQIWITVTDADNLQLVNTRLPLGAELAHVPDSAVGLRWAGSTGPPVEVSNLIIGKQTRLPLVLVQMPVTLDDGREVRLRAVARAAQFDGVFKDQKLPGTWTGSIVDATGALAARSRDSDKLVGRRASPQMLEALGRHNTGVVKTKTLDGVATYSAYNRIPEYGWAVIVGVPRGDLAGAARDSFLWAVVFGVTLLGLGIAAAVHVARRVARPVEALAAAARASGDGRYIAIPPSGMAEVDDLAAAFEEASRAVAVREAALRESETRFRLVAEDAPVMLWMGDEVGNCLYLNRSLREFWGAAEDLSGFVWAETLVPEDREAMATVVGPAMERQEGFEFEARYFRADGEVRTLFTRAVPRRDAQGRFVGMIGVNVDVTDARRAETHQQLLINELNHRVKNTLATVQSIAHQTLKGGEVTKDARDLLTSRLLALSAAHNVLTRENWEGAGLHEVVAEAVRPYDGIKEPRIAIDGPPLRVGPRGALALSMALHELGTNAAKYGALSDENGRVSVRWSVDRRQKLTLEWREHDGPPVVAPSRRGFGSRLLQQGLATELGGSAELAFEPDGLVCTIHAPLNGRD